jgi:hypothetical protein
MLIFICSLMLRVGLPQPDACLDARDAHSIAGEPTHLVARLSPPRARVEVEFFINRSSLGTARTDCRGAAVLVTGVTPATREIAFTAAARYCGKHLQSKARWFTSRGTETVIADRR